MTLKMAAAEPPIAHAMPCHRKCLLSKKSSPRCRPGKANYALEAEAHNTYSTRLRVPPPLFALAFKSVCLTCRFPRDQ